MHLLWANALQDVLVQASLFTCITTQRRIDCSVAETELEMPFVVSCDPNLELHALSGRECGNWPLREIEEWIIATSRHRQICRAEALRAIPIVHITDCTTAHWREIDVSVSVDQGGQGKHGHTCNEHGAEKG